jgi:crotonobetainyl-CoA:carnitine CoA-transferase CaiB-like acyl-CoA transferase
MARYNDAAQVLSGAQETARGIFHEVAASGGTVKVQSLPFRFGPDALPVDCPAPAPGADQSLLAEPAQRRASA